MTELKWLNFSGLMRSCLYNCTQRECPFNKFRKMDFIQQIQSLDKISESKGNQLLADCRRFRLQDYIQEIQQSKPIGLAAGF